MPAADAAKPNSKNTVDKPITKKSAGNKARELRFDVSERSFRLTPLIYARYGGTIGKTQGLRKDSTPAKSATNMAGNSAASMISIPNIPDT